MGSYSNITTLGEYFPALFKHHSPLISLICREEKPLSYLSEVISSGLPECNLQLSPLNYTHFIEAQKKKKLADYVADLYANAERVLPKLLAAIPVADLQRLREIQVKHSHTVEQILAHGYVTAVLQQHIEALKSNIKANALGQITQQLQVHSREIYRNQETPPVFTASATTLPSKLRHEQRHIIGNANHSFERTLDAADPNLLLWLFSSNQLVRKPGDNLREIFATDIDNYKNLNITDTAAFAKVIANRSEFYLSHILTDDAQFSHDIANHIDPVKLAKVYKLCHDKNINLRKLAKTGIQLALILNLPEVLNFIAKDINRCPLPNEATVATLMATLAENVQQECLPADPAPVATKRNRDPFIAASKLMKTAIAPITRTILEKRSRLINSAKKSVENSQKTGKKPLVQKPPADFTENVMMLAALLDNNNSDKATDRDLATALLKLSLSLKAMPAGTRQDALCNFNVHYQYLYSSSVNHDVTLKKIARFKYYLQNHYSLTDFQFAFNAFQQLLSPEDHERVAHYYQDMLHVDDCIVKKTVRLLSDHVAYQQQLASSKTTVHKFNIFLSQQSDVTDRDKHLVNQILTTAHLQLRDLEGDLAQTMQTSRLLDQARCTALEQRFHDCAQQSLIKPLSSLSLSESPIRQYLCELLVKIKQLLKIDSPNDKIYRFSRQVEQNIRENSHFKLSSPAPAA